MNRFTEKSFEIANSRGYLDNLQEIYPLEEGDSRKIPSYLKQKIKRAYDNRNSKKLIRILLDLEKFPVKDPYVGSLRRNDRFISDNPEVVKRIANRLYNMTFDEMLLRCTKPKELNRQMGPMFNNWLSSLNYPFKGMLSFSSSDDVAFFEGSENQMKNYVQNHLNITLPKEPDFLLKIDDKYIVGEAKFITRFGGHQSGQFDDVMRMTQVDFDRNDIIGVGIIDGVVWYHPVGRQRGTKQYKKLKNLDDDDIAMSALLLEDFIDDIVNNNLQVF